MTLDCICSEITQDHWIVYRRTVRSMLHNPSKFEFPLDQLRSLDKCLAEIENKVLNGTIFQVVNMYN